LTAALAVVLAVVVVLVVSSERGARAGQVANRGYRTAVATVMRGSLSSQLSVTGTLTYATQLDGSSFTIVDQALGTFTELPSPGKTVSRGEVLYRVSNIPVVLLYGETPAYRSLIQGDVGPDVTQLNRNLVALGDATRGQLNPSSDYFGAETAVALDRLQARLHEQQTGSLALGQAVFLPGRVRVAAVRPALGTKAVRGVSIAIATSTTRDVVVNLDASDQSEVKVGDDAEVTLPSGQVTPGVVDGIGTVVGSGSSGPTVPVYIRLKRSDAAGKLSQAPVQVDITTTTIKHALIVPIDALTARPGDRYAVETVSPRGVHHLTAVTLETFDDADGTVQVGGDLRPGERIVVPSV
jgi:multidrug efflux pump subunit AcrA (membrane-fusion protein)